MDLSCKIKPEIQDRLDAPVVYSLEYNLSPQAMTTVNGILIVTQYSIYTFEDNKLICRLSLNDILECRCEKLFGSAIFSVKTEQDEYLLASVSQERFYLLTTLSKAMEYYTENGHFATQVEPDDIICPKCGNRRSGDTKICQKCARNPKILLRLLKMCKPYNKNIVIIMISVLLYELLSIVFPYLQKLVIDDYLTPNRLAISPILLLFLTTAFIYVFSYGLERILGHHRNIVASQLGHDLRQAVFDKTQRLSLANMGKRPAGEMINRISNDCNQLKEFISNYSTEAVVRIATFTVIAVILFTADFRLALLVLLPVPAVFLAVRQINHTIHQNFLKVWIRSNVVETTLHDIINGIRVVKSYGNEKQEIEKYTAQSLKLATILSRAEIFWAFSMPIIGFIVTIGEFLVLYFGAEMVIDHKLKLGELIQYTAYTGMIYTPIRWAINLPRLFNQAAISANKVFEIIDEPEEAVNTDQQQLDIVGKVTFKNVSFGYKSYVPVLKKLNFTVNPGEMIGIVGASGVGKSTLINLVMRLYEPNSGEILIDDVPLSDISRQSLRSQIGVVLQETFLFDGSVLDNIRYAKPDACFEDIVRASKLAGAHEFILKMPQGYNTRAGDRGYMMSGGERQRIAIARAILHNPRILILDEATSALDTQTEKQIQDSLNQLIIGRTTFAIAHRLSTLRQSDRLLVLDKGKIVEFGTHVELLKNRSVYYNLVMAQRQTAKLKK